MGRMRHRSSRQFVFVFVFRPGFAAIFGSSATFCDLSFDHISDALPVGIKNLRYILLLNLLVVPLYWLQKSGESLGGKRSSVMWLQYLDAETAKESSPNNFIDSCLSSLIRC
mmetsp:Transcript_17124/g.47041  ORF Transcript_17124/g.47041 Transcript_17124/m.47041 type:complete len:112 (-) Transcript_17124:722-1057(-)